jgi:hypothetical protein
MIQCPQLGSDCSGDNTVVVLASGHTQARLYVPELWDMINLLLCIFMYLEDTEYLKMNVGITNIYTEK